MFSHRWCLCSLVWFLPLPCSKILNFAQENIKHYILGHSAVISDTVYLEQLKGSEQERPLDFSAIFESVQK